MENFSDWLLAQLTIKKWKQADLARASHLDSAVISNLISGKRGPGEMTCTAIADALGLPTETVFRAAGLLSPLPERRLAEEIATYKMSELTDKQLDEVLQYIEFIQDRQERQPVLIKNREGTTPPEVVKK